MTIFEAYNDTKRQLRDAGITEYVLEAKIIIKYVTKYTSAEILTKYNEELNAMQRTVLNSVVKQRLSRYPLQYIIGVWSFYGLDFYVGEGVLVPRPDTETVVDAVSEYINENGQDKEYNVLDLCAGTGCIGITLAKIFPNIKVTGVEKYDIPFDYFKKNISLNKTDNVKAVKDDIFSYESNEKFDIIVSNPPYVTAEEMSGIDPETSKEPDTALYGGEDGNDYYRAICSEYTKYLKKDGIMVFEIGFGHFDEVAEIMKNAKLSNIRSKNDLQDIKRAIIGTASKL